MRILCIIESMNLLKIVKNACQHNDATLKFISPDDQFESYFETFTPDVVILQDQYEDVSVKFLIKMLKSFTTFNSSIKLLITDDASNLTQLSGFATEENMLLIEQDGIDTAINTTVTAMLKSSDGGTTEKHFRRRKVILYVSDNRFMHIVIKDAFSEEAIDLIDAYDGDEAISEIEKQLPDLILTDLDIPGLSGIELCKAVKHNENLKHIPVIIYSSYERDEVFVECSNAGATEYFEKNMNPKEFAKSIVKYL